MRGVLGALGDRFWEKCTWARPADRSASCWWVANASEDDKSHTINLKWRSLACHRLELQASRLATTGNLRKEWERRVHTNETGVERLRRKVSPWRHVCGFDPEKLLRPTEAGLSAAQRSADAQKRIVETRETCHGQFHVDATAEELVEAVQQLKVVTWDAIRRDCLFPLTPEALFDELARAAASSLTRVGAESVRQPYLERGTEEAGAPTLRSSRPLPKDGWVDLEQFKQKAGNAQY